MLRTNTFHNLYKLSRTVTTCSNRRMYFKQPYRSSRTLDDISRSALCSCCHSNETRASIANPLNTAQLEGTPKLHPGSCNGVGMQRGTDRHTDTHTHAHADSRGQYISPRLCLTRNVITFNLSLADELRTVNVQIDDDVTMEESATQVSVGQSSH